MFDTYLVIDNGQCVGMFSIKQSHPVNKITKQQANVMDVIWCIGKQPQTLQCAVYLSKCLYSSIDVVRGYVVGHVTKQTVSDIQGVLTSDQRMLRFVTCPQLNVSKFAAPLFR